MKVYRSTYVYCILLTAACASIGSSGTFAEAGDKPNEMPTSFKARIGDLSWLAGTWKGAMQSDRLEERWSPPEGDGMVGMFRWIKNGSVWMYELLTIVEEEGSLTLRFKHFHRNLVGWEDNDKPLTFVLTDLSSSEAVFTKTSEVPWKYLYRRTDDGKLYFITQKMVDGQVREERIEFKRSDGAE